jgi:hypothetical protein
MIYRKLTEILLQFWINGYKLAKLLSENRDNYLMKNHARKSNHALVGHIKIYTKQNTKIKHHGAKGGKKALET